MYVYWLGRLPQTRNVQLLVWRSPPEPAWHRRLRAKRSEHRRLLQAMGAASSLASHHGTAHPASGMLKGNGKHAKDRSTGSGKGYWKCFVCQYMVPLGDYDCNGYGNQPPLSVICPDSAQAKSKGRGKGASKPARAEVAAAQVQSTSMVQRQTKAELDTMRKKVEKLEKEKEEA